MMQGGYSRQLEERSVFLDYFCLHVAMYVHVWTYCTSSLDGRLDINLADCCGASRPKTHSEIIKLHWDPFQARPFSFHGSSHFDGAVSQAKHVLLQKTQLCSRELS